MNPKTMSMIHESLENHLTRCFTETKARAAKWLVFCYAFSIEAVVAGAPEYRWSGVAQT